MTNANIASTQAAGFIPEIWLSTALGRLKNYRTILKTITLDTELPSGSTFSVGDTLHLPRRGAITVNDKTENQNYTVQNPTADTVDLTLNKHKEVTIGVESRAISTSNQNVIAGYVDDAVIAIVEQMEIDALTLGATASTNSAIVNAGTMTEANILSARKNMVDQRVLAGTDKFGIIATSQTNALLTIDRLVRFDALGVYNNISNAKVGDGIPIMPGSIGRLYNFEISESQLVRTSGSPLAALNLFYSRDAIMFASRALENPESSGAAGVNCSVMTDEETGITMRMLHSYSHIQGAHLVTLDVLYGFAFMREEHIVVVQTSA